MYKIAGVLRLYLAKEGIFSCGKWLKEGWRRLRFLE
jgi:hypothetical protein